MAVKVELTKEQILAKWNSKGSEFEFPTLGELDTMAHYDLEYLKEHGWEEREGIGFYFNDKYKTDRFTYWIDCNAVKFTCYRWDNIEKDNTEISGHDMRTGNYRSYHDVESFIAWLDTAIGHEEEYCIVERTRRNNNGR
jgi:hypothetical protein